MNAPMLQAGHKRKGLRTLTAICLEEAHPAPALAGLILRAVFGEQLLAQTPHASSIWVPQLCGDDQAAISHIIRRMQPKRG